MAQREAGHQIHRLQEGFDPKDWKPLHGVGSGVRETRIHAENEYRIIYVAQFEEALYILHSFVKKTQKTLQRDLELARERLTIVLKERRT
ncbi:MAG: type II toxin-antitoxin system RelE/ParE family toxin [Nitrospirae bacterium]|nr:type II toxin-antitoxin system RelE/ParE family toxin [Nitrospirota bacterium]